MPTLAPVPTADARWMDRAVALAREGMRAGRGGPFGALIVRGDTVVGEGCNRVTSSDDPTAHAEIVAIRDACRRLRTFTLAGCTLYASCEPCPMCLAAAHWARVARIVYAADRADAARAGFDDRLLHDELTLPIERRSVPVTRIHDAAAAAVFDEWCAKRDRIPY